MNLIALLARISAASAAVSAAGLFLGVPAAVFFLISASAFILLIAARDYAPRSRRWEPVLVTSTSPRKSPLRLAV
ncbi:MAG TPA: hypothetical protein VEQ65_11620 [Opitutus sp.]|nr:hypothetical protein [Opitutus sp.]